MRPGAKRLLVAAGAAWLFWLAAETRAQPLPVKPDSVTGGSGSGTNLSSVMYFEPPYDQQIMARLTGTQMLPLPGSLCDIKELKIERYDHDGKLVATVRAPQCVYAPLDGVASSTGHLDMTLGDGKIRLQGDGFLWQQNESQLTISNHVSTVIKMGSWKLHAP